MFQIHSRQAFPQSEEIDLASMPTLVFDSSGRMPRPPFNPPSRKMPPSVLNSPRGMLAPASISSPLLRETEAVAIASPKTADSDNVSAAIFEWQDIVTDSRGHGPITGLLAVRLQATMPTTSGRRLIVIPGAKKRTRDAAQTERSKSRHLHPRLRLGIPLGAMAAFILFSLFSLSPLSGRDTYAPVVGSAIQWVQKQRINWALLIGDHAPIIQSDSKANTQTDDLGTILSTSDYVAIARQAAISVGIPPDYFVKQIYAESGFNPYAHSPSGAVGIAQFTPSTAAAMGVNPYDPVSALCGAARYMARLSNSFGGDYAKALAAYNAGSAAVNHAVATGGANWLAYMPLETQNYVHKIMG
jgi:hypothetical protein